MASRPTSKPRPRRVSFQDTCAVIPRLEPQHNKPRLCTRTYSLCLSRRPSGDLLYDDTFIPNHPTTLTLHLPTITRAPPITKKRSRRSSTGGTPGFFGFKGTDDCGLKSCLHKSAHDASEGDIYAKKTVAPRGIHPTPPIVHCQPSTPPSLCNSPAGKVLPHILSPIRHNSHSQESTLSPTQPSRSSMSSNSSSGFGIGKVSSFVTRPFLRRSGSSTSSLLKDTSSLDSASGSRLSRSRSYSTSTTSSAATLTHPQTFRAQGRSQSFSSSVSGNDDDLNGKTDVRPILREIARHPGCIEEDVIEEEAVDDTELEDVSSNAPASDHHTQRLPTTITEEPTEITSVTTSTSSSILPIHDCCEGCARNTLLGMEEDYVPPFSESAIRKIQREREEHEQNMQVVADAAAAAGAAVAAGARIEEEDEEEDLQPKKIWNGKEWVLETIDLSSSEQQSIKRNSAIHDEFNEDEPNNDADSRPTGSGSGSRRGSGLFDTDKAKSMMVDEVEYVRRMRSSSGQGRGSSSNNQYEASGIPDVGGQKRVEGAVLEKGRHSVVDIPSPDHGVWITSKPTSPIRSPLKSSRGEGVTDYLSAKQRYMAPSRPTGSTSPSTEHASSFHRSDDRDAEAELVRQALQQEAEATRNAHTPTTILEKDGVCTGLHNVPESPPTSPTTAESKRKKWFKIPLPSPLAV